MTTKLISDSQMDYNSCLESCWGFFPPLALLNHPWYWWQPDTERGTRKEGMWKGELIIYRRLLAHQEAEARPLSEAATPA